MSIPKHLRERFPDEMTIVLQNKFWDLTVEEEGSRSGSASTRSRPSCEIPFAAITAFVDPAVDFGLQFQAAVADIAPPAHEDAENDAPGGTERAGGAGVAPLTTDRTSSRSISAARNSRDAGPTAAEREAR